VLRQKIPAEVVKDGAWKPYHLPFAFALLRQDGTHAPLQFEGDSTSERTKMLVLSKEEHTYTFTNVAAPVVPSLLRNFSAPVIVEYPYSVAELRFLLRFETDPYNRFEAGQRLAAGMILRKLDREGEFDDGAIDAFGELFRNGAMDPGFEALALTLPSLPELLRGRPVVDFEAAHAAREAFQTAIACRFSDEIASVYDRCAEQLRTARVGDGVARGLRALKNVSLGYLWRAGTKDVEARTLRQFTDATTMTDEQGALQLLVHRGAPSAEKALAAYLARWGEKTDVLPSWFSLQVGGSTGKEADVVERLAKHPLFDRTNPNLVRALYRGFAQNLPQFHRGDGRGYQLLADQIVSLDPINPTVASSLAKCFADYPRLDAQRRSILRACLHRISRHEGLSSGVAEVVTNTLSVSSS
jgi:aminopeptidase N